jgi:hypothetical protein
MLLRLDQRIVKLMLLEPVPRFIQVASELFCEWRPATYSDKLIEVHYFSERNDKEGAASSPFCWADGDQDNRNHRKITCFRPIQIKPSTVSSADKA